MPLGKYWRNNPLVFSFDPRCQGEAGSQKNTGTLENSMSAEAARQFKAERAAENPMRRFGTPEEMAEAAAFLAFDATYTTGSELAVDGGLTQL